MTVCIHATVHLHNSKRMLCNNKNRWWLHHISWKISLSLPLHSGGLNLCEWGKKDVKPRLMRQERINLLKFNGSVSCQQVVLVHSEHFFFQNLTLKTDFTLHKSSVCSKINTAVSVCSLLSNRLSFSFLKMHAEVNIWHAALIIM